MRWVAVLSSLAIAALSAATPSSLVACDDAPVWVASTADASEHDENATPAGDSRSTSEDDDLDELGVDGDELVAIVEITVHDWAPLVTTTRWWLHTPGAPTAPPPELSHRPPIAG